MFRRCVSAELCGVATVATGVCWPKLGQRGRRRWPARHAHARSCQQEVPRDARPANTCASGATDPHGAIALRRAERLIVCLRCSEYTGNHSWLLSGKSLPREAEVSLRPHFLSSIERRQRIRCGRAVRRLISQLGADLAWPVNVVRSTFPDNERSLEWLTFVAVMIASRNRSSAAARGRRADPDVRGISRYALSVDHVVGVSRVIEWLFDRCRGWCVTNACSRRCFTTSCRHPRRTTGHSPRTGSHAVGSPIILAVALIRHVFGVTMAIPPLCSRSREFRNGTTRFL
jgi:hypothetical protein